MQSVRRPEATKPSALHFLVATFAGWVNSHQNDIIAYLQALSAHTNIRVIPCA